MKLKWNINIEINRYDQSVKISILNLRQIKNVFDVLSKVVNIPPVAIYSTILRDENHIFLIINLMNSLMRFFLIIWVEKDGGNSLMSR